MTNHVRSLRLQSLTGQNLAEILMPENVDDDPILIMPTMGMYFEAQRNHAQPHVVTGPHRKHAATFLAYLAGIALTAWLRAEVANKRVKGKQDKPGG